MFQEQGTHTYKHYNWHLQQMARQLKKAFPLYFNNMYKYR